MLDAIGVPSSVRHDPARLHQVRPPRAISQGDADRAPRPGPEHGGPSARARGGLPEDRGRQRFHWNSLCWRHLSGNRQITQRLRAAHAPDSSTAAPDGRSRKAHQRASRGSPSGPLSQASPGRISQVTCEPVHTLIDRPPLLFPSASVLSARGTPWSAKVSFCTGTRKRRGVG
jgi:hypothetical protein